MRAIFLPLLLASAFASACLNDRDTEAAEKRSAAIVFAQDNFGWMSYLDPASLLMLGGVGSGSLLLWRIRRKRLRSLKAAAESQI